MFMRQQMHFNVVLNNHCGLQGLKLNSAFLSTKLSLEPKSLSTSIQAYKVYVESNSVSHEPALFSDTKDNEVILLEKHLSWFIQIFLSKSDWSMWMASLKQNFYIYPILDFLNIFMYLKLLNVQSWPFPLASVIIISSEVRIDSI